MNFYSPQAEASAVLLAVLFRSRYVVLLLFPSFISEETERIACTMEMWSVDSSVFTLLLILDLNKKCSLIDISFFVCMLVVNVVVGVPL